MEPYHVQGLMTGAADTSIKLGNSHVTLSRLTKSDWRAVKESTSRSGSMKIAKAYVGIMEAATELQTLLEIQKPSRKKGNEKKEPTQPLALDLAKLSHLQIVPYHTPPQPLNILPTVMPPPRDDDSPTVRSSIGLKSGIQLDNLGGWFKIQYGNSLVLKCYMWLFWLLWWVLLWGPVILLWGGLVYIVLLLIHLATHPELLIMMGFKIVRTVPAYTAFASERMTAQLWNETVELFR